MAIKVKHEMNAAPAAAATLNVFSHVADGVFTNAAVNGHSFFYDRTH